MGGLRDDGALCILCETPKTFEDWAKFAAVTENGGDRLVPIWRLVLPWSVALELLSNYQYNVKTLGDLIKVYRGGSTEELGYRSNEMLDRLQAVFPLRGRTVIEFGPSDGNRTSDLLAAGVAQVTAIEGRPENALKMLVAKYVMGWRNVDLVMDNFQSSGPWATRRYDLAFAQGVYYHCQNPFVFFDGLVRLSDAIFIGGWCCNDKKPAAPWMVLEHDGVKYRGKGYTEASSYLSGLASTSYMLDKEDIQKFFAQRGYRTKFCHVAAHEAPSALGPEYAEIFVVKE